MVSSAPPRVRAGAAGARVRLERREKTPAAAALVADTEAAPGPWEGGPWSGGAPFWELFYASGGVSVRPACRPPFPHRAWRGSGD